MPENIMKQKYTLIIAKIDLAGNRVIMDTRVAFIETDNLEDIRKERSPDELLIATIKGFTKINGWTKKHKLNHRELTY